MLIGYNEHWQLCLMYNHVSDYEPAIEGLHILPIDNLKHCLRLKTADLWIFLLLEFRLLYLVTVERKKDF